MQVLRDTDSGGLVLKFGPRKAAKNIVEPDSDSRLGLASTIESVLRASQIDNRLLLLSKNRYYR
jgi:hypothetical protein